MSRAQRVLLHEVRSSQLTLDEIRAKHRLENPQITRWRDNAFFWDALKVAVRETRQLRRLELEVAANVAAHVVGQAVRGLIALEDWKHRLLVDVIALAQGRIRIRRSGACGNGKSAGSRKRSEPMADICHPDAKEREKTLLAAMREEELASRRTGGGDATA